MIEIYTDGACSGNPGRGGWGAVILRDGQTREISGGEPQTTNNRMEMTAVIEGLASVPSGAQVTVYSDSQYVVNTMTKNWKRRKNQDLWARLDRETAARRVVWRWIRGHAGHRLNERADRLATEQVRPRSRVGGGSHLTHVDAEGKASMVDVGAKAVTQRVAVARGSVVMEPETLRLVGENAMEKGDVLGVARIAGIMAAKKTSELIPLCHPLPLDKVSVDLQIDEARSAVEIEATAATTAKTGVEMEALTAVSVAALTVYDMVKAVDRGTTVQSVRLVRKTGGASGDVNLE